MRRELAPHQECAQAAVERALRYAPGIRRRVEPVLDQLMAERDLPRDYSVLSPLGAVRVMRAAEDACREAGVSAQLFPCTVTGWQNAAARFGVAL